MKKSIIILLGILISYGIPYLSISFICWSIMANKWHWLARCSFIVLGSVFSLIWAYESLKILRNNGNAGNNTK